MKIYGCEKKSQLDYMCSGEGGGRGRSTNHFVFIYIYIYTIYSSEITDNFNIESQSAL